MLLGLVRRVKSLGSQSLESILGFRVLGCDVKLENNVEKSANELETVVTQRILQGLVGKNEGRPSAAVGGVI